MEGHIRVGLFAPFLTGGNTRKNTLEVHRISGHCESAHYQEAITSQMQTSMNSSLPP